VCVNVQRALQVVVGEEDIAMMSARWMLMFNGCNRQSVLFTVCLIASLASFHAAANDPSQQQVDNRLLLTVLLLLPLLYYGVYLTKVTANLVGCELSRVSETLTYRHVPQKIVLELDL